MRKTLCNRCWVSNEYYWVILTILNKTSLAFLGKKINSSPDICPHKKDI
jgi:hypothetical protein